MPLARRIATISLMLNLAAPLYAVPHHECDSARDDVMATPHIATRVISSDQDLTLLEVSILGFSEGLYPEDVGIGFVAVGPRGRIEASVDSLEASRAGRPLEVLTPGSPEVPADLITLSEPAIWRELRVVRVVLRPAWRTTVDECVVARVVVRIVNVGGLGEAELNHPVRPVSPHWDRLYRAHVLNYEAFQPPRLTVGTGPRYIVVSRSRFALETPSFVEWKTRQGYGVDLITLEDLGYTNPLDRGAINATKRHIMEAYTSWDEPVEFVLLTGDMYDAIPSGSIYSKQFTDILGYYPLQRYYDQWYALVDGPDLLPDIMVGRFPDTNVQRMDYQLSKTIGYEMNPHIEGAWQRNAIATATHEIPTHPTIRTKQAIADSLTGMGMTVREFYGQQATPANIIPAINQGLSFYNMRAQYCGETQWDGSFTEWDVPYVNNVNKLGVWTAISCSTADFIFGYPITTELLLRLGYENPDAPRGAVAVVGSQGYTHANFNNPFDLGFYQAFSHEGATLLGEAFVAAKVYAASVTAPSDSQTTMLCEYTVLGDPSLQVWTDVPTALAVSLSPPSVPEGLATDVSIQVADNVSAAPVPDALVCLWREDDVYAWGYSDINGSVILPVMPQSTGSSGLSIDVTVTGCNRIPWFGTVETTTPRPAPPEAIELTMSEQGACTLHWQPVTVDEREIATVVTRYEIHLGSEAYAALDGVAPAMAVRGTSATLAPAPWDTYVWVVAVSREGLRSRASAGVGIVRRGTSSFGGVR